MRGVGTRSLAGALLLVGAVALMAHRGLFRLDYWAQLSPWVPFVAATFAVLAGTLIFRFWRLDEKGEYYLRIGERLPLGGETTLGRPRGTTLLVGHAPQVRVLDFPPAVQRVLFGAAFLAVGLVSLDNRGIELLGDAFAGGGRSTIEYCPEPPPPPPPAPPSPGCRLVERAFTLGYTKSLGSCAPKAPEVLEQRAVCYRRQADEPYLHYAWRLFEDGVDRLTTRSGPGPIEEVERELPHLGALFHTTLDSISMQPRSSHHLFTNLPAPHSGLGALVRAALEHGCGSRASGLAHFAEVAPGPGGPSLLLAHVLGQLLFNPRYRPIVASCEEVVVHWGASDDACERLARAPDALLDDHGVRDDVRELLARRRRLAELAARTTPPPDVAPADRVVSLQCLVVADGAGEADPIERVAEIAGERLPVREVRLAPLDTSGASQVRLYKRAAELFAAGFGYGRLTSNQATGATPEGAALAASFRDDQLLLTKLELLRDADLFLGNAWLIERPDLLEVYPHHLHLENFVEIFRRQYAKSRGRL